MSEGAFGRFFLRVTACHLVTYFVAGILAFSILLVAWYRRPHKSWGVILYSLTVLGLLMSLAGVLAPR